MEAQTPVTLSPVARQQFFAANGAPLAGGCIFTYASGTTTPQATYTDPSGLYVQSNPILLDGGGFASIWLAAESYRFVLFSGGGTNCAAGSQQWLIDGVLPAPFSAGNNTWTGNETHYGTETFNGPIQMTAGGSMTGTFTGSPTFSGNPSFTGSPVFSTAATFSSGINVDNINGINTAGGTMTIAGASGAGVSQGESVTVESGQGAGGSGGGNVLVLSGDGSISGGPGGQIQFQSGIGLSANADAGNIVFTGGAGTGAGTGGAITGTAGTGGATAVPGANVTWTAGTGGGGGNGGNVILTPGAAGAGGLNNGSVYFNYGRLIYQNEQPPTCSLTTGTGTTGTCTLDPKATDSDGYVLLTAGGSSIAASGIFDIDFSTTMGTTSSCVATLASIGTGTWQPLSTVIMTTQGPMSFSATWYNSAATAGDTALTTGDTYDVTYHCVGRN